jgi:outer membrane lipoprotein-sorting protein
MLKRAVYVMLTMLFLGHASNAADAQPAPTPEQIRALVLQLGDESFQTRSEAERALAKAGTAAIPALEEGLKSEDAEIKGRCATVRQTLKLKPLKQVAVAGRLAKGFQAEVQLKSIKEEAKGRFSADPDGTRFAALLSGKSETKEVESKSYCDGHTCWSIDAETRGKGTAKETRERYVSRCSVVRDEGLGILQMGLLEGPVSSNYLKCIADLDRVFEFNVTEQTKAGGTNCIFTGKVRADAEERLEDFYALLDTGATSLLEGVAQDCIFLTMKEARVVVDATTSVPQCVELSDADGRPIWTMTFSSIKTGVTFEDSTFEYIPAPDDEVVDLDEEM